MGPSLRDRQRYVPGMGKVFVTPKKRRAKAVDQALVHYMGRDMEIEALKRRLEQLESGSGLPARSPSPQPSTSITSMPEDDLGIPSDIVDDPGPSLNTCDDDVGPASSPAKPAPPVATPRSSPPPKKRRRLAPKIVLEGLYKCWQALLPSLVEPLLGYLRRAAGVPVPTVFEPVHPCMRSGCVAKMQDVIILFWDHYETVQVPYCPCVPLSHVLVASGMFPTAPTQPRIAVSIDLLELYSALFERSGDAVTALACALRHFYMRRGWRILDHAGRPILDPFRKPLGRAIQWYDGVRILIERNIEDAVEKARIIVSEHSTGPAHTAVPSSTQHDFPSPDGTLTQAGQSTSTQPLAVDDATIQVSCDRNPAPSTTPTMAPPSPVNPVRLPDAAVPDSPILHPSILADDPTTSCGQQQAASILQRRCPACFGGETWGRPFSEGGDVVLAIDGNFSHRHLRHAGDSPAFYEPEFFVPKSKIDAVGEWIDMLRKKPASATYVRRVPDEAIDNCENGHEAADEKKAKTEGDRFDDTGVMAIICSHDIPLFMANIDTPGEQLKYAIGLIEHCSEMLPTNTTIGLLYDIACTCERSIGLYGILPEQLTQRLLWATSVMHTYGHQWSCQLVYNPRLCPGFGLRDGEGVERLWARLRIFIPITRTSGRSRRIWLLDRQLRAIAIELRDNLGIFITRKMKHGVRAQDSAAKDILKDIKASIPELRHQWDLQREAQLSVRAHAPTRVKREVNAVLTLQAEVDRVESAIVDVREQLQEDSASSESASILSTLQATSTELSKRVDSLYSSLNVGSMFPELNGLHAEVVRMLILTRDIKINIRKRVTAQLLEFDRINRAAGGRDNPLGTKLHQQTRKAIQRRQPAILSSIRKFNKYCTSIADLLAKHNPDITIPIPRPLSTDLAVLRDDPNLYEDVWITSLPVEEKPRWLEEVDIRHGIRAMLKQDRCHEEERRLRREANNLCRWFGLELAATELAMNMSNNALFVPLLQQRQDDIAILEGLWSTPLVPQDAFNARAMWSKAIVQEILRVRGLQVSTVIEPIPTCPVAFPKPSQDEDEDPGDEFVLSNETADNPELLDILEDMEDSYDDKTDIATASETCVSSGGILDDGESPRARDLTVGVRTPKVDDSPAEVLTTDDTVDTSNRACTPKAAEMPIEDHVAMEVVVDRTNEALEAILNVEDLIPSTPEIEYSWKVPEGLEADDFAELATASFMGFSRHIPTARKAPRTSSSPSIYFSPADYQRLADTSSMLNSDCINGCAALLQHHQLHSVRPCAIFSTYDVVLAAQEHDGGALGRSIRQTMFWERPTWLIPIHREEGVGHWTIPCNVEK